MKEIYRHRDSVRVGYYKTILEEAHIPCFLQHLPAGSSGMGMVAGSRFDPALCVMNDEDYGNAHLILNAHEYPEELDGEPLICPKCRV